MREYEVSFLPEAQEDILASYDWGAVNWGDDAAIKWLKELYRVVNVKLTSSPLACPVAPESDEWSLEIRQLIFLRYRILFTIFENEVVIVRVSGPYSEE